MTKLLYKSDVSIDELGQWISAQVRLHNLTEG